MPGKERQKEKVDNGMVMESLQTNTVASWIKYSLRMAEKEADATGAAAYQSVAERLTKFPYSSGLATMTESEYRRILGWNRVKSRIFGPKDSHERPAA